MKRILTIIGARPQIIKAAAISRAISSKFSDQLQEDLLHTGQHYDENMSEVFFNEMGIPQPAYKLNVGSGSHGAQTATMMKGIEDVLLEKKHDAVLVYGDTNSTIAGALAAVKIHIPVIHVEAGLRSFSKAMPEEINRILCDHSSTLLYSPTAQGISNLTKEGIIHHENGLTPDAPRVYHCGDIMYDNSLHFSKKAQTESTILHKLGIEENNFILCTIHRNNNTDEPERLESILNGILAIAELSGKKIVLPLHPRTKGKLSQKWNEKLSANPSIICTDPISFIDIVRLESTCFMVITDSGGVQKEAYFFNKPCIILREQTEWVELVQNGNAELAGWQSTQIISCYNSLISKSNNMTWPSFFGDGASSEFICRTIISFLADADTMR
jgi:UDP-GlcNAc3NAcA epimerase